MLIIRCKDKQNSDATLFFQKDYLNFATYLQIDLSMKTDIDLNKPLWQLTVGELLELMKYEFLELMKDEFLEIMEQAPSVTINNIPKEKRIVYGIAGIAQIFNCSMTTANRIKASGKIDRAISQCGRIITVDADMALELMKQSK